MDTIPRALAAAFVARGGALRLGADVRRLDLRERITLLELAGGSSVRARRVVLTMPIPALEALAARSPLIDGPVWRRLYHSNVGYSSVKLYAWYERPWWRDGAQAPAGLRTTTDLPIRKVFYFDEAAEGPAAILAAFTDFRYDEPIVALAEGASGGAAAPDGLLRELREWLAAAHPGADVPTQPSGSAIQRWGHDPREVGWHFWRAGSNSDEMLDLAIQPDPSLPIHIAGEVFSRAGAWVEGALMSARLVEARLLA
jgi:monoamine oxidase